MRNGERDHAPPHFQELARYNRLVNVRLFEACAEVPDESLRRPTGASLGSILAILEHVLAADRIWLARFRGEDEDRTGLLAPTFTELAPLRRAREAMDAELEAFFAEAGAAFYGAPVRSVDGRGGVTHWPAARVAAHLFNHQTHHRGQVHVLLREHRPEPLALDLHRTLGP